MPLVRRPLSLLRGPKLEKGLRVVKPDQTLMTEACCVGVERHYQKWSTQKKCNWKVHEHLIVISQKFDHSHKCPSFTSSESVPADQRLTNGQWPGTIRFERNQMFLINFNFSILSLLAHCIELYQAVSSAANEKANSWISILRALTKSTTSLRSLFLETILIAILHCLFF